MQPAHLPRTTLFVFFVINCRYCDLGRVWVDY